MARISRTDLYIYDGTVSDNDFVIGSDGDLMSKTKSYRMKDLRDYLLAGLSPITGGTLKYSEYTYNGVITSPAAFFNALNPVFVVMPYNVVILSMNGDRYMLKLQDVTVGFNQTPITDSDFILLRGDVSLGDGLDVLKGYNVANKKHEFYSLKSTSLNLSKETLSSAETGNILIEMKTDINLNIGVGSENVYKGYNSSNSKHEFKGIKDSLSIDVSSDSTDVSLEVKEIVQGVGTGIAVYKEFDGTTKKHKLRSIASSAGSINVTLVGDNVNIDLPIDVNNKSFYVDSNSLSPTEEGTLGKPFKTLNKALDVFIGTGTWYNPQNKGYKITLLSYATLHETAGSGYTGRTNLDINNLYIVGNGNYLNLPSNPSANYYPISTRRMVSNMPKTASKLDYEIIHTYDGVVLQRIGTDAVVDHLNYAYPTVSHSGSASASQNGSYIRLINTTITNDTLYQVNTPDDWTTVPNPNNSGNPVTLFGSNVYVSTVHPTGFPMLKTEGMHWNKEGQLLLEGEVKLTNFTGTGIYATNTTIGNTGSIVFSRNQKLILCQSIVSGIYNRKIGQYYVALNNVRYFALKTNGPAIIPKVAASLGGIEYFIGGSESWLKATTDSVGNLLSSYIEGGYENLFQVDGSSSVSIFNGDHYSAESYEANGYYKIIAPLPLTAKTLYLRNVVCSDFIVDSTGGTLSKIKEVYGEQNSINGFQHTNTGALPYANDTAAKSAGLFKGMEYITSTGESRKVI